MRAVSDVGLPFACQSLSVTTSAGRHWIELGYVADARWPSALRIEYAEAGAVLDDACVDMVTAAGAIYLGSLCLANEVCIDRALAAGLIDALAPIVEMLYDIRRWKDGLPLGGLPSFVTVESDQPRTPERLLHPRAAVALWSGGKDSTLALLTLQANGYDAHPLHFSVNVGSEESERQAMLELARDLGLSAPPLISIEHDEFLDLTNAYAVEWDAFPLWNRIPFGRDLLLAAAAAPFALSRGAACISLGHDNECRNAVVEYEGKVIPRNDVESSAGAVLLERVMRRYVHPDLTLLPPVATLSEHRILHDMFVGYGDLMVKTAFCFWGENCGRCAKCLRYYLADRVYGEGRLRFAVNPLSRGACPELGELLDPGPRSSTLFQQEVLLLLGRLAQRGDDRSDEVELERFRASHLGRISDLLDGWEAELLAERHDPQVPAGFRSALGEPILGAG